jgi:hypothetical protein
MNSIYYHPSSRFFAICDAWAGTGQRCFLCRLVLDSAGMCVPWDSNNRAKRSACSAGRAKEAFEGIAKEALEGIAEETGA